MRLDVDKAGGDRQPLGIDHPGPARRERMADRRDPAVANHDVADLAGPATAVDDRAAADQDIGTHDFRAVCALRS